MKRATNSISTGTAVVMIAVLLCMAALTACTGGSAPAGTPAADAKPDAAATKPEAPTSIGIMTMFYSQEPPDNNNIIWKEIEKRTHTKLDITWVSPNNYTERANVTLASGNIPDMMFVSDAHDPLVRQMAKQGAFWDITDMIKDYPNLMGFPADAWLNSSYDGRNFGIPRVRNIDGNGFLNIRKDWLDRLGLPMPKTMDELHDALHAFTYKDPDGNGKDDTVGFALYGSFSEDIERVFNKSWKWKEQDGKLVDTTLSPDTRAALLWQRKAFEEGLIPRDFAVMTRSQSIDMMKAGRAGLRQDSVDQAWPDQQELIKTNPQANIVPLVSLESPNGAFVHRTAGYFGVYLIPKKVPEDKVRKILAFMDYGASEEGHVLANFGFENVHHELKDGIRISTEQALKDNVSQQVFGQIFIQFDKYQKAWFVGIPTEKYLENKKIIDGRAAISVPNPAEGLVSDSYLKYGSEFDQKIKDMKTKVIMGRESIEAWDKLVQELRNDSVYQKIIAETNEAYAKRKQ